MDSPLANPPLPPDPRPRPPGRAAPLSPFGGRGIEFFEAEDGRLSMTRLLMWMSFWPAAYIACAAMSSDTYGWFISAYTVGYLGGKGADAFARAQPKAIITNAEVANVAVDKP